MQTWLLGQVSLMLILGVVSTIVFLSLRRPLRLRARRAHRPAQHRSRCLAPPSRSSLALLVAAIDSWGRVLGVAIFFFVYLQIENSWLIPRIMRNRVNLPALAIFVALLLGSAFGGILGAMVAIPTAVLVSVLIDEYLVRDNEA